MAINLKQYREKEISELEDDTLIFRKEKLIAFLTQGKGTALDETINELLEIERELTLREDQ